MDDNLTFLGGSVDIRCCSCALVNKLFVAFWFFSLLSNFWLEPCRTYTGELTVWSGLLMHAIVFWFFAVFEPYKDNKVELLGPKLLFIALNLGGLALGVWKVIYVDMLCFMILVMLLVIQNFKVNVLCMCQCYCETLN